MRDNQIMGWGSWDAGRALRRETWSFPCSDPCEDVARRWLPAGRVEGPDQNPATLAAHLGFLTSGALRDQPL